MNSEKACNSTYQQAINTHQQTLLDLEKQKKQISIARVVFVIGIAAVVYFLSGWLMALLLIMLFATFLRLVLIASNINAAIGTTRLLIEINEEEIKIANRKFTHRSDGAEYLPAVHEYAQDLDVLGRASLYQYLNRNTALPAQQLLAQWLLQPASSQVIPKRQEAIKELSPLYQWRQQLQAFGLAKPLTHITCQKILDWLPKPVQFINKSYWKIIRAVYPFLTLGSLLLYITNYISTNTFSLLFVSYVILSLAISRKVIPIYTPLGKIVDELNSLSNSINWIEQKDFTAPLLQTIQGLLNNRKAATSIRAVKNILDRFDYRLNPLIFIPLNAFLLWDLQQVLKLEKWKQHHQHVVKDWFSALSQMESLCSLANVAFNHPNWVFPKFSNQPGLLWITDAGHPLIEQEKRVTNSFKTATTPALALVTGSNMAGKSTFLRTVGINTVLALAGAPVCATAFTLYPMHIISSMRVADNLEENTSTFYAELKKLRHIIEVVNRKENVFLLLDEILRGTNSLDRHTGSKALIRQLIQQQACAVIATHDLELAKLTEQYNDSITNYHFDVQVSGEELYFDYRLKEGVCNSLNASILMKKIGIELNDNTTLGHL